jgi:hypothetical protein
VLAGLSTLFPDERRYSIERMKRKVSFVVQGKDGKGGDSSLETVWEMLA